MVRHIVTWKIKGAELAEKEKMRNEITSALLALKDKINEIRSISVHYNSPKAPANNHDLILDTTFDSFDDLTTYQNHPEHLKVVEIVKARVLERACVDFEY